jgi:hypothetical protein
MKTFKIVGEDLSDGFHTFDELYGHRIALYLALCKTSGWPCFWRGDHKTGWFILFMSTPKGQISYHLPGRMFALASRFAIEAPVSYQYDGHTPKDTVERLLMSISDEGECHGQV